MAGFGPVALLGARRSHSSPGIFTEQKQNDLGTKEKWVSREGWRKAPKGKTGIVRETGNDSSLHPIPSLAGRWGKERAGRALQATRAAQKRYHQRQSRAFQNVNSFGEEMRTARELKISSSK